MISKNLIKCELEEKAGALKAYILKMMITKKILLAMQVMFG